MFREAEGLRRIPENPGSRLEGETGDGHWLLYVPLVRGSMLAVLTAYNPGCVFGLARRISGWRVSCLGRACAVVSECLQWMADAMHVVPGSGGCRRLHCRCLAGDMLAWGRHWGLPQPPAVETVTHCFHHVAASSCRQCMCPAEMPAWQPSYSCMTGGGGVVPRPGACAARVPPIQGDLCCNVDLLGSRGTMCAENWEFVG